MTPDQAIAILRSALRDFTELELIALLSAAAYHAAAFSPDARNHALRAAHALRQGYDDRHASELTC